MFLKSIEKSAKPVLAEFFKKEKPLLKKVIFFALVLSLNLGLVPTVLAQTSVQERRAQLEKNLASLEAEIDTQRNILADKQKESVSLERDIAILDAKIKKAQLSIKARAIAIQGLLEDIQSKTVVIGKLTEKINSEKESLAELLRQTNQFDSYSTAEVILSNKNLSKFFEDVESFRPIQNALKQSFTVIEGSKSKTQAEKDSLEEKKTEQVQLQTLQQLEKKSIEKEQAEKQRILKISKGIESIYKKMISSGEESAAKIRTELFTLRGGAAIPFEKALELASAASSKTGVRPAFILGIIAEESNLGENVGNGSWRVDMKSPRDTDPFIDITKRLGLNPDDMPVSKNPWYGYGGAMGPAQFLPSTWIQLESRIADATGHRPPNPWDPGDSFTAAALYLKDAGASAKTTAAERLAALRYLAGWTNAKKKAYAFYGDDVMDLTAKYQQQINILQRN